MTALRAVSVALEVPPTLDRATLWRALVLKAEDPRPFLPMVSESQVMARHPDGLTREMVVGGDRVRERITYLPETQVTFVREPGPGWVANTISEGEEGLLLTFTFAAAEGGMPIDAAMARGAVAGTLTHARELLAAGRLAANLPDEAR